MSPPNRVAQRSWPREGLYRETAGPGSPHGIREQKGGSSQRADLGPKLGSSMSLNIYVSI